MKIHWKPQPRQEYALVRAQEDIFELLYGGARGGGKTDGGQIWLVEPKYIQHKLYRALVIRKNADDLSDWVDRAERMYAPLGAVVTGNPKVITFPSGAKIKTGHLNDSKAYTKYQGHEYQKMLIEELTQIALENNYEKLIASCRSTIPGLKSQVFNTTNPDGEGHVWVKERWNCENGDDKVIEVYDKETGLYRNRLFISAKVEDNPTLVKNDPGYVATLNNIKDPTLRKQWRDGSWEEPMIPGAYYKDQFKTIKEKKRITLVPHDSALSVDTWWDLGMSDYMCIWLTQNVGSEIRVIGYIEDEGEGLAHYAKELNKLGYTYSGHYFPHDIAVRELGTGVSRLETAKSLGMLPAFQVKKLPVYDGIEAVRNVLARCFFDKEECSTGISRLSGYKKEFDEKRNVYKDIPVHDICSHGADAFRTLAVGFGQYKGLVTSDDDDFNLYNDDYS